MDYLLSREKTSSISRKHLRARSILIDYLSVLIIYIPLTFSSEKVRGKIPDLSTTDVDCTI